MAYSEALSSRIVAVLNKQTAATPIKMMGGIVYMVNGNMCCGVNGDSLMVRVGEAGRAKALKKPGTRPMEFGGRSPKGFILVDAQSCATSQDLHKWIETGLRFVATLPANKTRPSRKKTNHKTAQQKKTKNSSKKSSKKSTSKVTRKTKSKKAVTKRSSTASRA